jgi:hypothetical protein
MKSHFDIYLRVSESCHKEILKMQDHTDAMGGTKWQ